MSTTYYGPLPPWEITEQRFSDMLNVLPPCQWRRHSDSESFHVSELLSGNIASWFCRLGGRYFELQDDCALTHWAVVAACRQVRVLQPGQLRLPMGVTL